MSKAYSVMTVKSVNETEETRTITGIASTPKPDRDRDVVEPKGATFALPLPLLWQHNHREPIGEVVEAKVTDLGIEFTAKIAKIEEAGRLKDRIDEAWQSIKSGLVKCVSIGFKLIEYNYLEDSYGLHVKKWEWYELSVVTVPANPDATISSVKQIKEAFTDAKNKQNIKPDPKTAENTPAAEDKQDTTFVSLVDPNAGSILLIEGDTL